MKEGWFKIDLAKVCNIISGKNQKNVINPHGKYPIYGSAGIFGYSNEYICDAGTTIIGRKGTINSPIYVNEKFWNVDTAFGLSPKENLNSKFLYFFCKSFNFHKLDKSTTIPSLAKRDLEKITIPIYPLPEQRAIASKIEQLFSELDNGIANLKSAKEKLEVYRQAVLKKAFEGELTKDWRESQNGLPTGNELLDEIKLEKLRYYQNQVENWKKEEAEWENNGKLCKKPKKPVKLENGLELNPHESQKIILLPKKYWTYVNIDFVSWKLGDGLHGTPVYSNGEYYFINGNNLQNGKIIIKTNTKSVSKSEAVKHYRELTDRTILISINGTLGNIAFYNNEKVMLGKSACYINLINSINKRYVSWIIESNEFKKYLDKTATGSTIKNVPLKAIRNFTFPVCSKEEQSQIVQEIESRLSVCGKLAESINESLDKSEALRQSILKKAISGELLTEKELEACKQEADWEPAEKLLERIKNSK